jgi:hypothetical protein
LIYHLQNIYVFEQLTFFMWSSQSESWRSRIVHDNFINAKSIHIN